jgi:hypothetical protein
MKGLMCLVMLGSILMGLCTLYEISKWKLRGMVWFIDRVVKNKPRSINSDEWKSDAHGYSNALARMVLFLLNSLIIGVCLHNWIYLIAIGVAAVIDQCCFRYIDNRVGQSVNDLNNGLKTDDDCDCSIYLGFKDCGYYYIVYNLFIVVLFVAMFVNVYDNLYKFGW